MTLDLSAPRPVHYPATDSWQFDAEVARVFDDMALRSIPLYAEMQRETARIVAESVWNGEHVVDLGAATGTTLAAIAPRVSKTTSLTGYEIAPLMAAAAREKVPANVRIIEGDVRTVEFPEPIGAAVCLWTLQFVPILDRTLVLKRLRAAMRDGGVLVVAEKIDSAPHVQRYHDWKHENGYSREEIEAKALALRGVLNPMTYDANVAMLRSCGFIVEPLMGWLNFAAWVAWAA